MKGVWGAIIRRTQLFLIFLSKGGNYLREAINRGIAIIQGNMVLLVIPLLNSRLNFSLLLLILLMLTLRESKLNVCKGIYFYNICAGHI